MRGKGRGDRALNGVLGWMWGREIGRVRMCYGFFEMRILDSIAGPVFLKICGALIVTPVHFSHIVFNMLRIA